MSPEADVQGPPGRNIVEEVLNSINFIFERILDRTITVATKTHEWTHAIPPAQGFQLQPIRFPLRQSFASRVVHYMIGSLVEVAEMNRNGNHSGIDVSTSKRMLSALFYMKCQIAKDYFDVEPYGEISMDELIDIMSGIKPVPQTITPSGEEQQLPDMAAVNEALDGEDMLQWYPNDANWVIFASKEAALYKPERTWQPEATNQTTEDVAPPTGTAAPGNTVVLG
jgi:hypothetical protein